MAKAQFSKFRSAERKMLEAALQAALERIQQGELADAGLTELESALRERLQSRGHLRLRQKDFDNSKTLARAPKRGRGTIEVSRCLFAVGQERVNEVVFRELIRTCGGTTLDAESLRRACFGEVWGEPSQAEMSAFLRRPSVDGLRAGRFVLWNPETGDVWVKRREGKQVMPGAQLNVHFRAPDGAAGDIQPVAGEPDTQEPQTQHLKDQAPSAEPPGGQVLWTSPEAVQVVWTAPSANSVPPSAGVPTDADATDEEVAAEVRSDNMPNDEATSDELAPDELPADEADGTVPTPDANGASLFPLPPVIAPPPVPRIPVAALLNGLSIPPEAKELIQELADTGPLSTAQWQHVLDRLTQRLLEAASEARSGKPSQPDSAGREE